MIHVSSFKISDTGIARGINIELLLIEYVEDIQII